MSEVEKPEKGLGLQMDATGADAAWPGADLAVKVTGLLGSGGMLPRKIFEIWVSETAFPAF
jgi:hypothetical protein